MSDRNIPTDERNLVEKLTERADTWQPWIDDNLDAEFGFTPDHMRYHQALDRAALAEIASWKAVAHDHSERLKVAAIRDVNVLAFRQIEHERDCAVEDVARLQRIIKGFMAVALNVPIADYGDLPVPTSGDVLRSAPDVSGSNSTTEKKLG